MRSLRDTVHNTLSSMSFAFTSEESLRRQFGIFLVVIILGLYFQISSEQFSLILGISALVFALELINRSMNMLSGGEHGDRIRIIKDVAAGAVLVTYLFAVAIGVIIFLPKIMELFK